MDKKVILLVSILTLFMSCTQSKEKREYTAVSSELAEVAVLANNLQEDEGYTLMKANCYVCHNPNTKSHDDILAPPFKGVKMHYLKEYSTKEEFVTAMVNWVQNPDEEKSLMFGAVKRFNIMPKLPLSTEDLEKIATYIYDNNVEQPAWMGQHMKQMKGKM